MSHLEQSPLSAHVYGSEPRLDSILARAALTVPNRNGVVFQSEAWSYAEIHGRARRLAGALAALGVRKGHRVAFWMNSRPEFLEILFGVSMLAVVASPLDYWWTKQFCQQRLTTYNRPKQFHVFEELRRTGIDKIARRLVRERVIASMAK